MTKKPVIQDEAFRRQSVELLEMSGKSVSEVAHKLGISAPPHTQTKNRLH